MGKDAREKTVLGPALRRLARRSLVEHPTLLAATFRPIARVCRVEDDSMEAVLREVVESASGMVPSSVEVGELSALSGGMVFARLSVAGEDTGGRIFATGFSGDDGALWVSAGGAFFPGIGERDDIAPEDLLFFANHLNDICPSGCWGISSAGLALSGGVVFPVSSRTDGRFMRAVAASAVDVVAYADTALRTMFDTADDGPSVLSEFRWEEDAFLYSLSEVFSEEDVSSAVSGFLSSIPKLVASGFEVERREGEGILLRVPFPAPGPDQCLKVLFSVSRQPSGSSIPSGIHFSCEVPSSLEAGEADAWVERLNGFSQDDDKVIPLVSRWQSGNWYHVPGLSASRRLMFYAAVPDHVRGLVDLEMFVGDMIREAWVAADRVLTARRFSSLLAASDDIL